MGFIFRSAVVKPASDAVRGRNLYHGRIISGALHAAAVASVRKITGGRHIYGVGNVARNAVKTVDFSADDGLAFLQPYRIGVHGIFENLLHRAFFHDSAGVHDDDVIHHFRDDAEVVRDKHDTAAYLFLYVAQKVKYLRLNGNVQSGSRFVRDDKLGVAAKSHCYHDALAHTARKLMRIGLIHMFGHGYAHKFQHFDTALFGVLFVRARLVKQRNLVQLITHGKHGVKTGHRFLEYHCDFSAANGGHFRKRHLGYVHDFFVSSVLVDKTRSALFVHRLHRNRFAVFVRFFQHKRNFCRDGQGITLFIHRLNGSDFARLVPDGVKVMLG